MEEDEGRENQTYFIAADPEDEGRRPGAKGRRQLLET